MKNTTKKVACMLASLLAKHGVSEAVVSPGTRNAPLLIALERHPGLSTHVVIDERSAAFIALGISSGSYNKPVALVCTSGTAPLNYAPAIAEAFYRHIPLIVITADRPLEWIDQDDSQTINQVGIYSNFIKGTFDIPGENDEQDNLWMINRSLNDAMLLATSGQPGPVHINVRLSQPLGDVADFDEEIAPRVISLASAKPSLPDEVYTELCDKITTDTKILILAGFMPPSGLDEVLIQLSSLPNVVVMHEAQSNIKGLGQFVANIDAAISMIGNRVERPMSPDLLITLGGSLTSGRVKAWLRGVNDMEHWIISDSRDSIDCFRKLTVRIDDTPLSALNGLLKHLPQGDKTTEFKEFWRRIALDAPRHSYRYAEKCPWSDFLAMSIVMKNLPEGCNLQLSNGTSVRYVQLFDYSKAARIDCNRGVSGIDGCTSTAIGAALMSDNPTILITGDMSMQYDIGALACTFIPRNFKIIVLCNGGGEIFRIIPSTRSLDELERNFVAEVRLPLAEISPAYGFKYFSASNVDELNACLDKFLGITDNPAILEIKTDGNISSQYVRKFLNNK